MMQKNQWKGPNFFNFLTPPLLSYNILTPRIPYSSYSIDRPTIYNFSSPPPKAKIFFKGFNCAKKNL